MVIWDEVSEYWEQGKKEAKRDIFHMGHVFDPTPAAVVFSRQKAVHYAHTYYSQRNMDYPYFEGHDCTNFVSQCWTYAGIPVTEDWFCDGNIVTHSWSWVADFADYMVNRGYARISYNSLEANLGDVIQFYHRDLGGWHHSVIITRKNENGDLEYSSHSNNLVDKPLSNVYPVTGEQLRFICPYNAY